MRVESADMQNGIVQIDGAKLARPLGPFVTPKKNGGVGTWPTLRVISTRWI